MFHYLENGFIYDTDEERDLLKFWTNSNQDVLDEIHLFMTYEKDINILTHDEETAHVVVNDEIGKDLGPYVNVQHVVGE